MDSFLKEYKVKLRTLTPLYIGSGKTIGKKEYVFSLNDKKVYIPDVEKMYKRIREKDKIDEFTDYMLDFNSNYDLLNWLRDNNMQSDFKGWTSYVIDANDGIIKDKNKFTGRIVDKLANKDIPTFIKDAYGNPYIPGSSIKGAIRTVILYNYIINNKDKFLDDRDLMRKTIDTSRGKLKKDLSSKSKGIESKVFNTLKRLEEKPDNMVNSNMSGIKISDSKPLSVRDLILCQKIDVLPPKKYDGKKNPLNILRECIKPKIDIEFSITIDTKIFPYDMDEIQEMITTYNNDYQKKFVSVFDKTDTPCGENTIYIGGGVGFPTKTIIYGLYERKDAVEIVSKMLESMFSEKHKHNEDITLGVSPHTLKCTKLNGRLYEMGKCNFSILSN
ncbi:MAG: type III-A CRISPR-associated RAMP protein Csm5 [Fusobacteriaceae bacterium]|jgi:CRISPR-associated protein Csm5|nr:type III-A CRISPR-associated RAMP protein Csm5 [Fusobacteriaceae bacterium]